MSDEQELTAHTVSILAAVAQAKEKAMQERFIQLLKDSAAEEIAREIVKPSTNPKPEIKEAADGIRRWAENQRQPRKPKHRYAYSS